jgi:histidinol-phosphate/aromatic aminotransferase/cobyric acid decarboxylase-like protein/choline kinase
MKAVILAAGIGRRLLPITERIPKCLVQVKGRSLLLHQLDAITDCGINKIVLVVGYKKELVQKQIGNSYRGVPVEYVINDDYATTNNIYSLWLAKDHLLDDDVILMECDIVFQKELLLRLLEHKGDAIILVDRFELGMDGTVVEVNQDGVVRRLITRSEQSNKFDFSRFHKTINVHRFSRSFLTKVFVPSLEIYIKSRGVTSYYELVLAVLVYVRSPTISALSAAGLKWYEIDDENDLERAEYIFSSPRQKLGIVGEIYGGFWRYDFTDFSYLTNPYFPTDSMVAEMKYRLQALISDYPAGQEELDRQVSRMFNISPRNVVVGSGSSQLIQLLSQKIPKERVAVALPTFNEYERILEKQQIIPYLTERDHFQLNLQEYGKHIRHNRTRSTLLINPDNPTGYAVRRESLLAFLDSIKDDLRLLILDESFTDLVDGVGKNTLLQQHILERYPFLVIVRSLSKEFGVAGLRLGLLASGNSKLVGSVRERLPIWNINSLAEFFMESFLKYRDEYKLSCERVIQNRNVLYEELARTEFLKPYPSFANFVFCEVTSGQTASLLRDRLFMSHNILIKDCSNKSGLKPDRYVRIASRTSEENRRLLSALRYSMKSQ